jgi:hypothetical protein
MILETKKEDGKAFKVDRKKKDHLDKVEVVVEDRVE